MPTTAEAQQSPLGPGGSAAEYRFLYHGVMKTTLDLRDDLVLRAKAAAREHKTLTKVIEEGLALRLRRRRIAPSELAPLPVSSRRGAPRAGIDPCRNASWFDAAGDDS